MITVLDAVADAFTSVSVLVAALFVLFGLVRVRWGRAFEALLTRHAQAGPALAVAATLPPGCIGVLAVSRLYVAGTVSYGTAIAALVSTMGDTAWLLLAKDPVLTLVLKGSLAVLGCATGMVVDRLGMRPGESDTSAARDLVLVATGSTLPTAVTAPLPPSASERSTPGRGPHAPATAEPSGACCPADEPDTHRDVPRQLTVLFLGCLAVGLALSLPATLHLLPEDLTEGPLRAVGIVGTAAAIAIVLAARGRMVCGEEDNDVEQTVPEVLRNCSREAAFVTVWVSGVFLTWELLSAHVPMTDGKLPLAGVVGVLVGATAGLVPACGVEILVSALFVTGVLPAPALVAYLVSQDGNGFIPIATRRPRAALHGTVLTTAVALAVGLVVLAAS